MIRLAATPSFIASCWFELEVIGDSWLFTFCKVRFEYNNEEEMVWQSKTPYTEEVGEIERLSRSIIAEARKDGRFMIDGIMLTAVTGKNGKTQSHDFISPEADTDELRLIQLFMGLSQQLITAPSFVNYIELLEQYLPGRIPVKIFDEKPKRARIYGSLSIFEKARLTEIINSLSNEQSLVVDMTNFTGMGTALYECFRPLNKIDQLSFLANECAEVQLKKIGFEDARITSVR